MSEVEVIEVVSSDRTGDPIIYFVAAIVILALVVAAIVAAVRRSGKRKQESEAELDESFPGFRSGESGSAQAYRQDNYDPSVRPLLYEISEQLANTRPLARNEALALDELCARFSGFARENGITITPEETAKLFSTMITSRLLWVPARDHSRAEWDRFFSVLGAFFAVPFQPVSVAPDVDRSTLLCEENGTATPFLCQLYTAALLPDRVSFIAASNAEPEHFYRWFFDLLRGARAGEATTLRNLRVRESLGRLPGVDRGWLTVPGNVWYFMLSRESVFNGVGDGIPLRIRFEIAYAPKYSSGVRENPEAPAAADFLAAGNRALDHDDLPMDCWSRVDTLEDLLREESGFSLDNRVTRRMEDFYTLLWVCGLKEPAMLDCAVAYRLLPMLTGEQIRALSREPGAFEACLEDIFGSGQIPETLSCWEQLKNAAPRETDPAPEQQERSADDRNGKTDDGSTRFNPWKDHRTED